MRFVLIFIQMLYINDIDFTFKWFYQFNIKNFAFAVACKNDKLVFFRLMIVKFYVLFVGLFGGQGAETIEKSTEF